MTTTAAISRSYLWEKAIVSTLCTQLIFKAGNSLLKHILKAFLLAQSFMRPLFEQECRMISMKERTSERFQERNISSIPI